MLRTTGLAAASLVAVVLAACADNGPLTPRASNPLAPALTTAASVTSDAGITPVFASGNASGQMDAYCKAINADWNGFKIDPPNSGAFAGITYTFNSADKTLAWSADDGVRVYVVAVKGGNGEHAYYYNPPFGAGASSFTRLVGADWEYYNDGGLVSPDNASGEPAQISHFGFCYESGITTPPAVLAIRKTADTFYKRTWAWTIDKSADKSSVTVPVGGSVTVNYSVLVDVANGFPVNSDWVVRGRIFVTNTGGSSATLTSLTDDLGSGFGAATVSECDVDGSAVAVPGNGGAEVELPAGSMLTCRYEGALASEPSYDASAYTNTATVLTKLPAPVDTRFDATEPYDFASAQVDKVDECVDVDDTLGGVLGTVCAADAPKTFNYSYDVTMAFPSECGVPRNVPNTATATANTSGTQVSDSWNVLATLGCQGCTPGFWKNNTRAWGPTGLATTHRLDRASGPEVFGAAAWPVKSGVNMGTRTMAQALDFQGGFDLWGKAEILLRAGTAALLNASWNNGTNAIAYPLTADEVRTRVRNALASGDLTTITNEATALDDYNNLGCPVNARGGWVGTY